LHLSWYKCSGAFGRSGAWRVKKFFLKEVKSAAPAEKQRLAHPIYDPAVGTVAAVSHVVQAGQTQWYPPVMVGAETVVARLFGRDYMERAIALMQRLTPDDYTTFLVAYFADGLRRFGGAWRYADIVTVLLCLADLLAPRRYLEIGVRRGRSVAAVATVNPDCALVMFDMWVADYAGMANPGSDFVRQELVRVGHHGPMTFVDGDSHVTVPDYMRQHPDETFDLMTVDGDHSTEGAVRDLCDVLPRLNVGGAIVFDDVCHPAHPELGKVWRDVVSSDPRFSSFTYSDCGYGVGFAIRKF
jgi:predicted O-methyltransferase YrrM